MDTVDQAALVTHGAPAEEVDRWTRLEQHPMNSLGALLFARIAQTPGREAYRWRDDAGTWRSQTWAEAGRTATEIAAGLLDLGLQREDRVAIMSATRVEWIHVDLGIMCAGGATTTIYPTSAPDDVAHILTDSGSRIAVVERAAQAATMVAVEHVVVMAGPAGDDPRALTLAALRERGAARLAAEPGLVEAAIAAVAPDHLATLIYTSGTTGRPKGVRLPHRCWLYEATASEAMDLAGPDDLGYMWLPFAHSFGKSLLASQLSIGHPAAVDGDVTRIIENLPVVRPTVMPAVPRIFEKVHAGVLATVQREGGVKARLFGWAVGVGRQVSRLRLQGRQPGWWLGVRHRIADRLVLAKLRARFGGRIRYFISGSAALSPDIAEFFDALGMPVLEGYGLTESSAATLVNRLDHLELGTVGMPLPGTVVAIAPDGEILIKGPGVMDGYHGLPQATAETLVDGWLHTGDIGEVTDRGSLRITDRKKNLIKTSTGKYVVPAAIETRFAAICPLATQIVVHGDNRNYITALIDLDPDAVRAWAAGHGLDRLDYPELVRSPRLRAAMDGYVEQLNAGLGRWESIRKYAILAENLTVEGGDLTPSLKLRRRQVEQRYAALLDELYD